MLSVWGEKKWGRNVLISGAMSCDEFAQRSTEAMYLKFQFPTKRCYVRGDEMEMVKTLDIKIRT
jgi:hypothetical protein